ncbi:CPBP family glutamic-type intramembrane protease [Staphylococcus lutrae]|uniref:CAAX prenyl protease 2/Lysostaphin resistance protein A-like domain-containing protein n=2 Tax=Staphylococcus lutrae TaxID=155085 RepID=A0AAC9RSK1_9STAP|nr:CPBP family glutamic-type intramembrane protease [Staphylococcus lutrae]ARJ50936.1 hypothetical protein B5P37_06185 [Staphylococcus lutrae]
MKKFESLLLSVAVVVIVGFSFNIGILLISLLDNDTFSNIYLFLFVLVFIINFIFIPVFLINRILGIKNNALLHNLFNWKRTMLLFSTVLLFSIFYVGKDATIEYFIVAFGEEFLFRHLIFFILLHAFNKKWSILIGSLLFALLLHLNGNFFVNILTKFPVSILLYYLANKYKLQDAISVHWLYNVMIYRLT